MKGYIFAAGQHSRDPPPLSLTMQCCVQVDSTVKKGGEYVDSGNKFLSSKVNSQSGLHHDNMKHFDGARGKVVSSIEGCIDYLKKEGFSGTAQTAVGLVANALEDAKQLPAYLGRESQVGRAVVTGRIRDFHQDHCDVCSQHQTLSPVRACAGSDAPPERGVRQAENLPSW